MDLRQAIYGRRATRAFSDTPVDRKHIDALIDAAIQAPTAMNAQPWAFCVVRDAALLDHISREAKAHLLRSTEIGLAGDHFAALLADENFHIFYHAPALIAICTTESGDWSATDCTLAAQNMMLMAYSQGLGSCWIGFAQGWLGTKEGRAALDLPASWNVVAPIIIGYPKDSPQAPVRRSPLVHWCD